MSDPKMQYWSGSVSKRFYVGHKHMWAGLGIKLQYFNDTNQITSILSTIEKCLVIWYQITIPKELISSALVSQ